MADQLVDSTLKRGHSNWLESSHNIFIRFKQKHIFLERLHYHVATNLGLLQANQTQEYSQEGPGYHSKIDLLQRLNLPVYDGVRETLRKLNRSRSRRLDAIKTTKAKKRRVFAIAVWALAVSKRFTSILSDLSGLSLQWCPKMRVVPKNQLSVKGQMRLAGFKGQQSRV